MTIPTASHGQVAAVEAEANPRGQGQDLLFFGAGALSTLSGDGKGGFVAAGPPYRPGSDSWLFAIADFNRDGRSDLAVGDEGSVVVLLHN